MLRSKFLLILPLVVCVTGRVENRGIEYDGTSNVRVQNPSSLVIYHPESYYSPPSPISTNSEQPIEIASQTPAEVAPQPWADIVSEPSLDNTPEPSAEFGSQPPLENAPQPLSNNAPQPPEEFGSQPSLENAPQPLSEASQPPTEFGFQPPLENAAQPLSDNAPQAPTEIASPPPLENNHQILSGIAFQSPVKVSPQPSAQSTPVSFAESAYQPPVDNAPQAPAESAPQPPATIASQPLAMSAPVPQATEPHMVAMFVAPESSAAQPPSDDAGYQPIVPAYPPPLYPPRQPSDFSAAAGAEPSSVGSGHLPPLMPKPEPNRHPVFHKYTQPTPTYPLITQTPEIEYVTKRTPPPTFVTRAPSTQRPIFVTPAPTRQPPTFVTPAPTRQPSTFVTPAPTAPPPTFLTPEPTADVVEITQAPSRNNGTLKADFLCKDGDGFYAISNECDTYVECKDNRAMKYDCPDGLHFNPVARVYDYPCAYPAIVKCNAGNENQNPNPTNQCPRQYGFFSMNDGDCSKYIMCQDGIPNIMNCPPGLVFNDVTDSCDWQINVPQCNPNIFKDFTCPDAPLDQYGHVSDIIYKYKFHNQCRLYIACQRGHPRLLSCESGLAFDEHTQSCIDVHRVADCATAALYRSS